MSRLIIPFTEEDSERERKEIELLDDGGLNVIPINIIRSNLRDLMRSLSYMLHDMNLVTPDYALDGLSVAIGIDGKGKVGFLGIGGEAGASATLTLQFKRAPAVEESSG